MSVTYQDDDLDERLTTIEVLGELGDAGTLKALRAQMTLVGKEYHALVIAVGKLKKRLGVK
jgi:hypothetical protein